MGALAAPWLLGQTRAGGAVPDPAGVAMPPEEHEAGGEHRRRRRAGASARHAVHV